MGLVALARAATVRSTGAANSPVMFCWSCSQEEEQTEEAEPEEQSAEDVVGEDVVPVVGVAKRVGEDDHAADGRRERDGEKLRPLHAAEPGRHRRDHREQPWNDAAVEQERGHDDDRERKPPDHTLDDPIFRLGVTDRDEPIDRIEAVGKLVAQSADVVTQGEREIGRRQYEVGRDDGHVPHQGRVVDRDVVVTDDARDHPVWPTEVDDDVKPRRGQPGESQQLGESRDRHVAIHPQQTDRGREDDPAVGDAHPPDEGADVDSPRDAAAAPQSPSAVTASPCCSW